MKVHSIAALCATCAAVLYVATSGPTVYWLDSSEFAAAAWTLGVAHSPGHPLASLLARVLCYLPVGSLAFRVTLASALQTAAAVWLMTLIGYQLANQALDGRTDGLLRRLAAAAAALCGGCAYPLWFQAVRTEVYALNLVALLLSVFLLLRWDERQDHRFLFAAALSLGLALCNHHLLVLLAGPPIALFVVSRCTRVNGKRLIVGATLAVLLGLCVLAYLPLRSQRWPAVNWGAPHTLRRFAWVVSAKGFQKSVNRAAAQGVQASALGVVFALVGGPPTGTLPAAVGLVVTLCGLLGLYLTIRRSRARRAGLLVIGLIVCNLVGPALVGFDPFNPDAYGYLALSAALLNGVGLAVVGAGAAERLARQGARLGWVLAVALLAVGPVLRFAANLPRVDLQQHWAAEETAHHVFDLPPGSLLFTSYFQTVFNAWSLQTLADARPDVQVVHRNFLRQPGYVEGLVRQMPAYAVMVRRWASDGAVSVADLDRLARERFVAVEYDLNIAPALAARLQPYGLTLRYSGTPSTSLDPGQVQAHRRRVLAWARDLGTPSDLETRRALVWTNYLLARLACTRQWSQLARLHYEAARRLAPQSHQLRQLRDHCEHLLAQK